MTKDPQPSAPELLTDRHDVSRFESGEPALDDWLKKRARANQAGGASRTFVSCVEGNVVGYYALSAGSVQPAMVPGRFRRNMPDPIPVVILARLAVHQDWQGRRLGRSLVFDAVSRVSQAADIIGVRGIFVHAISTVARQFYLRVGFTECPGYPLRLVILIADARSATLG